MLFASHQRSMSTRARRRPPAIRCSRASPEAECRRSLAPRRCPSAATEASGPGAAATMRHCSWRRPVCMLPRRWIGARTGCSRCVSPRTSGGLYTSTYRAPANAGKSGCYKEHAVSDYYRHPISGSETRPPDRSDCPLTQAGENFIKMSRKFRTSGLHGHAPLCHRFRRVLTAPWPTKIELLR